MHKDGLTGLADRLRPWIVWLLRIVVGAIFMLSGFVKMVDVWGFVFKIEDYLAVWHFTQPRSLVLVAAVLISAFEFVLGAQLLTGSYKRSAPALLTAMMTVWTPLTAYIVIANPVDDCGCFGEFIHLSNGATFGKNLLLMAALVYLCINNPKVKWGFFKPAVQWIESLLFSIYILAVGLYGYNVQPMLDFRPYPVGASLVETDDDSDVVLVYEKDGVRREFAPDSLPDDDWIFVEAKGIDAPDHSILIYDDGEEVSEEWLGSEGEKLLLVITEPKRADIAFTYAINEISDYAAAHGVEMIGMVSGDGSDVKGWTDISMATYPVFTSDDTSLKQLARGVMALVMLSDGKVAWKRTVNSISVDLVDKGIADDNLLERLAIDPKAQLKKLTFIFLIVFGALFLFQGTVIAVNYAIRTYFRRIKTKAEMKKEESKQSKSV